MPAGDGGSALPTPPLSLNNLIFSRRCSIDYFTLTWREGQSHYTSPYQCEQPFEVMGDRDSLEQLWFTLSNEGTSLDGQAPRFIQLHNQEQIIQERV